MRAITSWFLVVFAFMATTTQAQSLKGSRASVRRMAEQAKLHKFDHMLNSVMVSRYVRARYLVHVENTENFVLHGGVTFPYARPATKLWLERFSRQYRSACGEKLIVTSLLRTLDRQPRNASKNSVHPTGMSVDLRVPRNSRCRRYLERNLLMMEKAGFLEATRERRPPHYHVAVYSRQYLAHVKRRR